MFRLDLELNEWEAAALRSIAGRSGLDPTTMARRLLDQQLSLHASIVCGSLLEGRSLDHGGWFRNSDEIEARLSYLFDA
jgi:hypothetical protein